MTGAVSYGKLMAHPVQGILMNTFWRTLYQHLLALRIWWRCKRDPRIAGRIAHLLAVLSQDTDADAVFDRLY
jgi:predicted lipid carrier protein YhbT